MAAGDLETRVLERVAGANGANGCGEWRIGALADALGRAVTVLGAGAEVAWVTVGSPWRGPGEPLFVHAVVRSPRAAAELRARLADGEHSARCRGVFAWGFGVDGVNDIDLQVTTTLEPEGASSC
jgi:hypothetical protein